MAQREPKIVTPEIIFEKAAALCRHVKSLEEHVATLKDRIEPWKDEKPPVTREWRAPARSDASELVKAVILIEEAENHLRALELDFAAIRSTVDSIANGTWLSYDLKAHIDVDRERKG